MFNSEFKFGGIQEDGTTIVLKDGEPASCPVSRIIYLPHKTIAGRVIAFKPACNKQCLFFQRATKTENDITEEGYAVTCGQKNIFVKIDPENKIKK